MQKHLTDAVVDIFCYLGRLHRHSQRPRRMNDRRIREVLTHHLLAWEYYVDHKGYTADNSARGLDVLLDYQYIISSHRQVRFHTAQLR